MPVPQGSNVSFNIFRGFNKNSPISISGSPIAASGYLKNNVELGRFGFAPNGLYWTTVIDVPVATDARDAWNSFLNTLDSTKADTVLIQDYPIVGWCTPFMLVAVQRLARSIRALGSDRYRLYVDRCQPVLGACPTSGTVTVPCCGSTAINTTLHVTVTDSGTCPCIDGTYTLNWNPSYTCTSPDGAWVSNSLTLCGGTFKIAVYCHGGLWHCELDSPGCAGCGNIASSATCSPLSLTFTIGMSPTCEGFLGIANCTGNLTLTVTN